MFRISRKGMAINPTPLTIGLKGAKALPFEFIILGFYPAVPYLPMYFRIFLPAIRPELMEKPTLIPEELLML